ncbi:MAG: BamA/TamA family outer membrane protein [Muribaculaceae bacterium]|nr:BamA/TamA family outer membrane protein [Muribaculaceae bacterium]
MKRTDTLTLRLLAGLTAILGLMTACSTTSRLAEGEVLYTGVKSIKYVPTDNEKLPEGMVADLNTMLSVKPNNPWPLLSPPRSMPWQPGLWVYNHMSDSAKGLKGWFYRNMVKDPVLISEVRAPMRVKMVEEILGRNGYFGSTATYNIIPNKKNDRKAMVSYNIAVSSPYLIDTVMLLNRNDHGVYDYIDSLAKRNEYLRKGERFCVDSLESVRTHIVNRMRNRGYYYMRPEYIEFLADSLINPHHIALKLDMATNIPRMALLQYRTGEVTTIVMRRSTRNPGTPDTIDTKRGKVIQMLPSHLRKNLIPSCITFRKGKFFSVADMDRTQTRLARLGIFSDIELQPVPADTSAANPLLNMYITCRFDRPMEATLQANVTSKSNSYLGPGLILGLTHHNLFGGGEKLNLQLTGSYEWQTGKNRGNVFNSYEASLSASLAFPRLLAPNFIRRMQRELNWTTITLSADLLNRPHYFKMAQFNAGINYEWRYSRHVLNSFTPFKLTYTKLLHTTHEFDSVMAINPAVALSFRSQYIPQMSYTYTYDRFFERAHINGINFTFTLTEAGNIFDGIYKLFGVKGEKRLFGTPFSQFVKGQAQVVYSRRLIRGTDQWLVSRVLIGAEHAYGNSREVPYSEQFYIGGANSIRAFTVRSLGPGSYHPPHDLANGYFDQTGTFKLELNTEYRFPIVSILHGALFLDAGNIWLLRNDPLRPGGQLQGSTFLREIALGTGVGLRVDLGMMVLRGDLGYGLHTPYRDGTYHYFNVPFKKAFAFHLAIGYPF